MEAGGTVFTDRPANPVLLACVRSPWAAGVLETNEANERPELLITGENYIIPSVNQLLKG